MTEHSLEQDILKSQGNTTSPHIKRPDIDYRASRISSDYRVRLIADLSARAFKTGQDKELALWHCLRSLNVTGSGAIMYEEAIEGLQDIFNYSRRTAFRHLAKGEGLFWERVISKRGSQIKIYGVLRVCLMFDTSLLNNIRFYEVETKRFNSMKYRRLALWCSIHKPRKVRANPISRASLTEYTGISKRQQCRYDSEAPTRRTPNFRVNSMLDQKRLPNIYHNNQDFGHKGMLVRVRRNLRSFIPAEALEERIYFKSIRKAMKSNNRAIKDSLRVVYTLVRSNKRQIKGRLEWQPIPLYP